MKIKWLKKLKWPNLDGKLSGDLEYGYRMHFLPKDIQQAMIGMVFFLIPLVFFSFNDFIYQKPGFLLYILMAFRCAFTVFGVLIIFYLARVTKLSKFDRYMFIFGLCGALLLTFINYTRPPNDMAHMGLDIIVLLIMYLIIPTRLSFRLICAWSFTIADIVLLVTNSGYLPLSFELTGIFSLLFINVAGLTLSHRLYSYRRIQYVANLEIQREMQERQALAEKLNELYEREKVRREQLQEEAQAKSHFIDVLAHELRTPLTPILSSSELLEEMLKNSPDPILKKLSSHIFTGSEVLANRLEELLELARYSRGAFKLNLEPTDVTRFIDEVVTRFKPTLDKNRQHLNLRIAQGLQNYIIDSSRIEQVVVNLLSNASKYSPPQTLISLSVKNAEKGLWLEVQDEGKGISKEEQTTLFQPYHRLKSVNKDTPGLGLGLSICKQIIEAHGGKIWVSSVQGKGSTFGFWVPAKTELGQALHMENHIIKD